jgi:hypothetical protein
MSVSTAIRHYTDIVKRTKLRSIEAVMIASQFCKPVSW